MLSAVGAAGSPAGTVQALGLELDLRTRRIRVDGEHHDLSAREFALAEEFLRHPDQVLSREQLLSRVWGFDFDPASNVVEVYVRYLRGKIGPERIENVRGAGYRLRSQPGEAVLAQEPKLLLVDEPVAGMTDAETAETAILLKEIAKTRSVVVVEHDMGFIRDLGVKVTCLAEGSVLAEGSIDFVSADQKVIENYLGR